MSMMTLHSAVKRIEKALVASLQNTLPRPLFARLMALRQDNPDTPFAKLPTPVRAEVKRILACLPAGKAGATTQRPPAPPQQVPAPQRPIRPVVPHAQTPNGHTSLSGRQANGTRPPPYVADENAPTVLGTDSQTGEAGALSLKERFQGEYCIGATGTGKTTLLLNMILSDIYLNR